MVRQNSKNYFTNLKNSQVFIRITKKSHILSCFFGTCMQANFFGIFLKSAFTVGLQVESTKVQDTRNVSLGYCQGTSPHSKKIFYKKSVIFFFETSAHSVVFLRLSQEIFCQDIFDTFYSTFRPTVTENNTRNNFSQIGGSTLWAKK